MSPRAKTTLRLLPERSVSAAGVESAAGSVAARRLSSPSAPTESTDVPGQTQSGGRRLVESLRKPRQG